MTNGLSQAVPLKLPMRCLHPLVLLYFLGLFLSFLAQTLIILGPTFLHGFAAVELSGFGEVFSAGLLSEGRGSLTSTQLDSTTTR